MEASQISARIKLARQRKGLSRREVASQLDVDVTAVAAWETGRYMPRDAHRAALAKLLEVDLTVLLGQAMPSAMLSLSATPVHGSQQDQTLAQLTERCQNHLTIIRIASPFATVKHQMREFRQVQANRILDRSLEVRVMEIFYSQRRLQETISNIFRFEGCKYLVKTFAGPNNDVLPGVDTYIFDNSTAVLASYWATPVMDERPLIEVAGEPFASFAQEHWKEVWRRAIPLNPAGTHDLSALCDIALELGVSEADWPQFVERAKNFSVGDDVPPLP